MSRVFTPKRMNALEDQVREYCRACLDPFVGTGRFDFVKDLGQQMPMRVIGMLLGIPESDQEAVRHRADEQLRTERGKPMDVRQDAIADGSMFAEYVDWRAQHPSDDLMTALLNAEFEDDTGTVRTLSRDEVLTYTQVIAGAGNETTGRLIGWLGKLLGDHPDQRRALVEDRALIPNTIEETLRFQPTGLHLARYVARDVEYYGTTVPAGSAILLLVGSANRDERRHDGSRPLRRPPQPRPAPHLRVRLPLLPRRIARPARRAGRARRGAEPLPRLGGRRGPHRARADVDRPRLADAAGLHRLTRQAQIRSRSSRFRTLPDGLRGSASTNTTALGTLNLRELVAAVLDELVLGRRRRVRRAATTNATGTSPHRSSGRPTTATSTTAGVLVEHPLDLGARDVLAAGDDHVLEPVDDEEVAVVVEHADVAGVEPAAGGTPRAVASGSRQ